MKNPTAILMGDIHLREDQPECRTDNYFEAQAAAIRYIAKLQRKHNIPVLAPGDVFNDWKASPFLLGWALQELPDQMIAIPGQHDLPWHRIDHISKSAINVIHKAGRAKVLDGTGSAHIDHSRTIIDGFPFGAQLEPKSHNSKGKAKIALCHVMTWTKKKPFPHAQADSATQLLRKLSGYKMVLTGDNHEAFVVEVKGRLLINPGSMMQMTASQADHKPRVYLWKAEDNDLEEVFLPIHKNAVTREHIEVVEERDKRIDAFVDRLHKEYEVGLSFEENLEEHLRENKVSKEVRTLVRQAVEE